jgi:phosphoribosyl-AMP cyclohydrolase
MSTFTDPATLSKDILDEGTIFAPRFGADGLLTAVAQGTDGTILMVGHMNAEALSLTIATGEVHYFSRSRGKLWKKGETSGDIQRVIELRIDCDQDVLLAIVEPQGHGAACHTGRRTCFYRRIENGALVDIGEPRLFDPATVYR